MTERVYEVELSPMARQTGVTYLHDVFLDAGEELAVGDRLSLRDEGGDPWLAEVMAVESARIGRKFRLRIHRTPGT
jgi:hypothetical protein